MSEEKTYVFPEGAGGASVDPNLLLAMNNGGGFGGGMWNNPIWAIVLLAFLRNGFGWGGNDGNCANGFISSQLGQAIQGNANAISNLATSLNCTEGQILGAVNAVQSAIQSVGAQNNLSFAQTINAVQAGNASIVSQLQSCCCDVKNLVTTQGYETRINNLQQSQLIQNGFAQVGYAAAENACAIKQNATDNTGRILAKLDAIEDSRKDREINSLTAALTAANSRAERQAELAPLYKAVSDIQCKLPNTATIPYSPVVGVPSCVAYQYGLNGLGVGYGSFAGGNGFL